LYLGTVPLTAPPSQAPSEGLGATEIANRLGIARASVYRLLEAAAA
jgi:hypothetical protein